MEHSIYFSDFFLSLPLLRKLSQILSVVSPPLSPFAFIFKSNQVP